MCFGIRIWSPIHLTTLAIPIQNQKCLKNAKKRIREQHIFHICVFCSEQGNLHTETAAFFYHFQNGRKYSVINIAPFGIDHILCPANQRAHLLSLGCQWMHLWRRQSLGFTSNGKGKIGCVFAFLRHFWFWMGIVTVVRWIGLEILFPNHMPKSQIQHLEQILAQKC